MVLAPILAHNKTDKLTNMTHYTGRFEVKRMVQARLLRKVNVDSHYTNAIYSFLKELASKHVNNSIMVSADAKCKISVGEPGFPIAGYTWKTSCRWKERNLQSW